ncbi:MAG: trigger factor [Lachnospiraceae bacterium]|nr:trigger factor [Lachnospiraceae bacterium]
MNYSVEKLEKSEAKLTITVDKAVFEKAIDNAYQKNKNKINVPGFRKGKATRQLIEKMYGAGVFYEDAANEVMPDAYDEAAEACGLEIVSRPTVSVEKVEKGADFVFTAVVAVRPEVTLGSYKGIEVERTTLEVTDEEIDKVINREREANATNVSVTDRAVADGDTAYIDYEGFCDGVAFDGGKGENYGLVIGSHSFIDTFEDQIVGHNIGDEFDVNVKFPDEYHAEELKGKPAVFKVKVNEIKAKVLPELDDEFASEVSDFETFAEYKEDVKKNLLAKKEEQEKSRVEDAIVEKIIADSKMEISDKQVKSTAESMAEQAAQSMQAQGISLEMYLQYTGMDIDKYIASLEPTALKKIQYRLVLEEVAKAENIAVTDEEYEAEIEKMAKNYQMEVAKLKEYIKEKDAESIKMDLRVGKALDFVYAEAK